MKTIVKQIGTILLISGMVSFFANSVHPRKIPWVQDWSNQVELKAKQKDIKVIPLSVALERFHAGSAIFVDARSADDYSQGHIPGALSIPFESLDAAMPTIIELIDSGKKLVLYCTNRTCDDALLLASELKAMGCRNLLLYVDGFQVWKENGGAVEAGT